MKYLRRDYTMKFRDDERGLALGVVVFIAMLVVAAVLYIMMDTAMAPIFGFALDGATSSGATAQIQLAQTIWGGALYAIVFIAALFLIARAVNEGGV